MAKNTKRSIKVPFSDLERKHIENYPEVVITDIDAAPIWGASVTLARDIESSPKSVITGHILRAKTFQSAITWIAVYIKVFYKQPFNTLWNINTIYSVIVSVLKTNVFKRDDFKPISKRFRLSYSCEDEFTEIFMNNLPSWMNTIEARAAFPCMRDVAAKVFKDTFEYYDIRRFNGLYGEEKIGFYVPSKIFDAIELIHEKKDSIICLQGAAGTGKSFCTRKILKDISSDTDLDVVVTSLACKRVIEFVDDVKNDMDIEAVPMSLAKIRYNKNKEDWCMFPDSSIETTKVTVMEEATLVDMSFIDTFIYIIENSDLVIMNGDSLFQHNAFLAIGDIFMLTCQQLLCSTKRCKPVISDGEFNRFRKGLADKCKGKVIYMEKPYRCKTSEAESVFMNALKMMYDAGKTDLAATVMSANIYRMFPQCSRFSIENIVDMMSDSFCDDAILAIKNDTVNELSGKIMSRSLKKGNDVWKHVYMKGATDELYNKEPVMIVSVDGCKGNPDKKEKDHIIITVESLLRPEVQDIIRIDGCYTIEDAISNGSLFKHIIHQNVSTLFSSQGNTYDNTYIIIEKVPCMNWRTLYVALTRHRYKVYLNTMSDRLTLMYDNPNDPVYYIVGRSTVVTE